ncbi:Methionine synthase [Sporomusa ovata DSM 2662]|uniref:5-methyltetrahydrofolate--homocysteine methyltransferase n=1 Tax=Sporomusa ovata TaxID=2378 RepID=A0A0U1KZD2_9FIRM|nr:B12-binding domain-containing protein [Sporomusa ovata]EQB27838.1 trimethylamine corrinoid protein 2 [Sporomusa ovata DSM 2662]CQR72772.1 5-methyltetrahydrofolate--homocysteine methyltransferase [Sporomusa ovata]
MGREQILKEAFDAITEYDEDRALEIAKRSLAEGLDYADILANGFGASMRNLGDLFSSGDVSLPELVVAAEVMQSVAKYYDEQALASGKKTMRQGKIVLATVEGDIHDIGKGIVASLIKSQGFQVIDLGRDVPVSKLIDVAVKENADIIGTSALLTTTILHQKELEEQLKRHGLKEKIKTMVGGAPCTQRWASRIGADAYAEDGAEAVKKTFELLQL